MYLDYICYALGGAFGLTALGLAIWLIVSGKSAKNDKKLLSDATETYDAMSITQEAAGRAGELSRTETACGAGETEACSETTMTVGLIERGISPTATVAVDNAVVGEQLDISPLKGRYIIEEEIKGGGMSRIFRARHVQLGNEWIVKFIAAGHDKLAGEADVLKQLNHICLPQIIDIFHSSSGTFIVESFIEGYPLNRVLAAGLPGENIVCQWGEQLAQVLNYLHSLPSPIIHCDLKPSNIMVTRDNKLVLIDFGISRQSGESMEALGLSYGYAAPEQYPAKLGPKAAAVTERQFGALPADRTSWQLDCRTDIFSTGVILYEAITGDLPTHGYEDVLYRLVSRQMADVICRCLAVRPDDRYQSAAELLDDLQKIQAGRISVARRLIMRRTAAVAAAACFAVSLSSTAYAAYVSGQENMSVVNMDPAVVLISAQQAADITITKTGPDGKTAVLEPEKISWSYSADNVARVSGGRILGINPGSTTIYGKYRNKIVSLEVTVTEPVEEMTHISLVYTGKSEVEAYAGTGERGQSDAERMKAELVSPESITIREDGAVIFADSGCLRSIESDYVNSWQLSPDFLTPDIVRTWGSDVFFTTGAWQEADGRNYYGIAYIAPGEAGIVYKTDAVFTSITDFCFDRDGILWFVEDNEGEGKCYLKCLDPGAGTLDIYAELPEETSAMCIDDKGNFYFAAAERGIIIRMQSGEDQWEYFAGVDGERHFIDGDIPYFYQPMKLCFSDGYLYVLDFDVLRRISVDGGAEFAETIAGEPTNDTWPGTEAGPGMNVMFTSSPLAEFAVSDDGSILLTDPKNAMIWRIIG